MRYLVIVHIPLGRSADGPGRYTIGDMWLEDLRAQARALRAAGFELTLASPLLERLDHANSGSFNLVTIRPQDEGFDFRPLPFYLSMPQYLKVRRRFAAALEDAIGSADVIHCGYGGHPVSQGQVAWPIAGRLNKKRIWIFDGADPFPRLELDARQARSPVKRLLKLAAARRFERFCAAAVREADLVFAHNAAVVERFRQSWGPHCHQFDRSFVTDATVISDEELGRRRERLWGGGGDGAARPLRLVAAGRQIRIKGTDQVLRAMRRAMDAGAALELDVLGEGEDLPAFRALAAELGLDRVVRFAGTVPYGTPLFDAWAAADVMVITNLTAEISRNVLLGMARGLPLVIYSNPGTDALVRESGCGTVVPCGDIAALSDALLVAARDRAALADQAARGVSAARRNTLDATHHRRAELAAALFAPSRRTAPQPRA